MTASLRRHAGVKFPPPLVYIVAFLLGYALHRLAPDDSIPVRSAWPARAVGWGIVAAGAGLAACAVATLRRARTTVLPFREPSALVASGPYGFTRNPMYVGLAIVYVGLVLLLGFLWPVLFLPAALFVLRRVVIAREEEYLRTRFGDPYTAYCARVGRWLGRTGEWQGTIGGPP